MPELDLPGGALFYETAGHISAPPIVRVYSDEAMARDAEVEALAQTHFVIGFATRGSDLADATALLEHLGFEPDAPIVRVIP